MTFRILPAKGYVRDSNARQRTETVRFNKHKCERDVTFKQMTRVRTGIRIIPNHSVAFFCIAAGDISHIKTVSYFPLLCLWGRIVSVITRDILPSSLINSCGNGCGKIHSHSVKHTDGIIYTTWFSKMTDLKTPHYCIIYRMFTSD